MNVKRFFSASSREAIKQVRADLGDEAVILSNRAVDGGVEVIASAQDALTALIDRSPRPAKAAPPEVDPATLPTIARIAQARQAGPIPPAPKRAPAPARGFPRSPNPAAESFAHFVQRSEESRAAAAAPAAPMAPAKPAAAPRAPVVKTVDDTRIIAEIQQMKSMLHEQMGALSWRETASRRPLEARQVAQMLSAGYSPALARALAAKLPADFGESQAAAWLQDSLIRNLSIAPAEGDLVNRGGVYALVGPTGVGKTTTAAKLAARCAVKYGAKHLGLITVDNYRIGAEDQLRAYGKILGVTVHTARDARTLADLIALMHDKHLVLIDSVGMGQRDSRLAGQMQMLNSPSIEPVMVLNAAAQGETLDDVVRLYGGRGSADATERPRRATKTIVSKIDEAVKFGFVLDCLIRHKLELQYVTNGQRVPEDLHPANLQYLVHRSLKHGAAPAFALAEADIPLVLATATGTPATAVAQHA